MIALLISQIFLVDWINAQLAELGKACGVITTPISQIMHHSKEAALDSKEAALEKVWLKQSKGIQIAFARKKANMRK